MHESLRNSFDISVLGVRLDRDVCVCSSVLKRVFRVPKAGLEPSSDTSQLRCDGRRLQALALVAGFWRRLLQCWTMGTNDLQCTLFNIPSSNYCAWNVDPSESNIVCHNNAGLRDDYCR